jgi:ABC-type polysaccharide/polyol phosphate transport system ATPase subunit
VARLGFSIATAWVPEVLILDEVLAVGDAAFTAKCERRLEEFHRQGSTVLLVSHSAAAIAKNCQRCLWLDRGRLRADGSPAEVLALYGEAVESEAVAPAAGAR